jgi:hypothetical protein
MYFPYATWAEEYMSLKLSARDQVEMLADKPTLNGIEKTN